MHRLPLALVLLLVAPMAFAQIYTWTDGGGTVHFSEAPPAAGIRYKQITVSGSTRPGASAYKAPVQTDTTDDPATAVAPAPAGQQPDTPANRGKLCATLVANLATLRGTSPVVIKQGGKDVALADSQRRVQLDTAEAQYRQYCQNAQ